MDQPHSRWNAVVGDDYGRAYADRFAQLADSGTDVHGEARFCAARLAPGARVVDAGCGTGRVAIWLAEQGFDCLGVDVDASMLAEARQTAPDLTWIQQDLTRVSELDLAADWDMVVAAGNVIPLLAAGTEPGVVRGLAGLLRPGGQLVAGFGLDARHLPLPEAPLRLADYDTWCRTAGLQLRERYATWDGAPYDHGGYAVSVHVRPH